ncbi:MAG: energy-coupling factor transporter transmembrane component T [Pseudomonadota bacterium]|nr:energy-coupling factor transporter transmembrane component T [Pseudomonadota bacterium]
MTDRLFPAAAPVVSPLRNVDPRVKIAAAVSLSILVFQAGPGQIVLLSLFLALLIVLSGGRRRDVVRILKPIALFAVLLFFLHALFTPGREVLRLPLLPAVTHEGLAQGGTVAWQFAALVVTGGLLTLTTLPSELVAALDKLLRPLRIFRVPTQDLAVMAAMALRFAPTFLEEYQRMKTARLARGGGAPGERLSRKLRTTGRMAIALILGALRRAEELAAAMEARGYARGPRTSMRELRLTRGDYAAVAVMASFTGLFFACRLFM